MKFYEDKNYVFIVKAKYLLRKKENENVDIEHENENEVMETDEILHETVNDAVNQSLEFLECSSLKVLESDRTLSIGKRKIKDVITKFKNVVSIVLSEPHMIVLASETKIRFRKEFSSF